MRKALGFSSIQLFADDCAVPFQTIVNYEQGKTPKVPHTFLLMLAERYGISIDWLLLGKGSMRGEIIKIPGVIDSYLSDHEVDLLKSYRMLSKKKQEKHYYRIKADAAEAEDEGTENRSVAS
jgi:transcriptional regulator with XRE-family HTH domain